MCVSIYTIYLCTFSFWGGVSKISPHNEGYSFLGSILGSP